MTRGVGRRWFPWVLTAALLLVVGSAILTLPTTTFQGVNYRVTAYRIPAYVKAIDLIQRHYQYGLLVSRICGGKSSDEDCVIALFNWTHENIRPTPAGWPVVDDHPLNIAIRGYGKSDQMADLFTILSVYAGVPAFFKFLTIDDRMLVLSFVQLDGKWIPFDVEHHTTFRNRNGQMANVDELLADPALVDAGTGNVLPGGLVYSRFVSRKTLAPFVVPSTLRGELQQPIARLGYELRRLVGMEPS